MRRREPDDHPRGRLDGFLPCPDGRGAKSPPIGPPECRPTPSRWLRTSPRGRVRLDRDIREALSRNRRPRVHTALPPQYACHFEDSQPQALSPLRLRRKPRKPFLRLVPSARDPRPPRCPSISSSPRPRTVPPYRGTLRCQKHGFSRRGT